HSVADRGNAQRPLLRRSRFGNVNATHRLRTILAGTQLIRQFPDAVRQLLLELRHRHPIGPWCAFLLCNLLKRSPQVPFRVHLVNQPKPFLSFHPREEGRQHANGPGARFDPPPLGGNLSGLLSQRHCRRFMFRLSGHSTSISCVPSLPRSYPVSSLLRTL